jgi:hypothetical protein
MEELKENPQNSKKSKLIYFLIILIIIPIALLFVFKSNLVKNLKIPINTITKNETKKFDSKYFSLKIPSSLKKEKSTPELGILELKSVEKNGAFKVNVIEYNAPSAEGGKTPLENVMNEAILRERPYYAKYSGKTEIEGKPTLIFSSQTSKDPATQKDLPPLKAYYIYDLTKNEGKEVVKVTKIIYWGDQEETKTFEKLISEMQFKSK